VALVDLTSNSQDFDFRINLVTYNNAFQIEAPTSFNWFSDSSYVEFSGSDFTYDASRNPLSGMITAFTVNIGADGPPAEISVTSISNSLVSLSGLSSLTADQQNDLIWRTVLVHNDRIKFGDDATSAGFFVEFAGDGRNVEAGQSLPSGNDKISGDIGGGEVFGDFYSVASGATLYAGNDKLSASGNGGGYIYGDTGSVNGIVHGGDDKIVAGVGIAFILGDASIVGEGARLFGGSDTIAMKRTGTAYGDANQAAGTIRGGSDAIRGSNGNDTISGDVYHIYGSGFLVGGRDVLQGGRGNDKIYGDWSLADSGATAVGGNDKLYGQGGDDELYGNGGADLIEGGAGADKMHGGGGADTFVFATGNAKDTVYDFAASGRANDIIDLSGLRGVDNFNDAKALFESHGKDVWIEAGHGDVLVLKHVDMHDLNSADFTF
jgi:Ca2+-binding RTX toxin-like protein